MPLYLTRIQQGKNTIIQFYYTRRQPVTNYFCIYLILVYLYIYIYKQPTNSAQKTWSSFSDKYPAIHYFIFSLVW